MKLTSSHRNLEKSHQPPCESQEQAKKAQQSKAQQSTAQHSKPELFPV
jgi:hypothetical protein